MAVLVQSLERIPSSPMLTAQAKPKEHSFAKKMKCKVALFSNPTGNKYFAPDKITSAIKSSIKA
jgi:hypothetical protein